VDRSRGEKGGIRGNRPQGEKRLLVGSLTSIAMAAWRSWVGARDAAKVGRCIRFVRGFFACTVIVWRWQISGVRGADRGNSPRYGDLAGGARKAVNHRGFTAPTVRLSGGM